MHFYVKSGSTFGLEIEANTPREAVFNAFKEHLDPLIHKSLSIFAKVSVHGYDGDHDDDMWYDTAWLLRETGMDQFFEVDDEELRQLMETGVGPDAIVNAPSAPFGEPSSN
jgi:hypothetical protein